MSNDSIFGGVLSEIRVVAPRGNVLRVHRHPRFRPGKVNGKHDATPSASLSLLTRTVNEEEFSVPRLSIIIPHRHNDQRLEETILSVLENRPRDCEVIVVHDGSYRDPYDLGDEVVYVQEEQSSSAIELLNAGLMAACSPVVCTLLDGVTVSADWAESALKRFANASVSAVSVQVKSGRRTVAGISEAAIRDAASLRAGRVESTKLSAAAPTLAAGFYRRKSLLVLDGWNEEIGLGSADVELAILMNDLGMLCECESQSLFEASVDAVPNRRTSATVNELAGIAASHGIASPSFVSTITSALTATFTGTVGLALAWSAGLRNQTVMNEVADRIAFAKKQLDSGANSVSVKMYSDTSATQMRRAA